MAQSEEVTAGQKRGPGRPTKSEHRFEKKRKISTTLSTPLSSSVQSPTASSPAPEKQSTKLPWKISENRPLPTLPEPQAPSLSSSEYHSIAASAVLQSSLDRSRLRWVSDGVLERYWVKPESGKNARPAPPNNPELKWQKHKGPCRIRIEPHIFEAEVYVEEKAKPPPAPVKPYVPPNYQQSAYGQPYRQNQPPQHPYGLQQQYYQNRTLPAMQQPTHGHPPSGNLPPMGGVSQSPPPRTQQSPAQSQQEKKAPPDPVISMLANRASSDPELKTLMKEVATGNATQEQLKVFQSHIDELTKIINDKNKKEEEEAAAAATASAEAAAKASVQQSEMIQYDGVGDTNIPPPYQQQPQQRPYPPVYQQPQPPQQTWAPPPPPAPTSLPVILAFTTPGATEDRFLFPQNSILEALSPQHLLASFIVTRKGTLAGDPSNLDPNVEYWQPVTLMVEVAYNREHILDCVRRWVKPADEVRKEMEEVMGRCTRVPETFLALRLPFKGSAMAMAEVEDVSSTAEDGGTPGGLSMDERAKGKKNAMGKAKGSVKYVKKALKGDLGREKSEVKGPGLEQGQSEGGEKKSTAVSDVASTPQAPSAQETKVEQNGTGDATTATATLTATAAVDGANAPADAQPTTESGRPRRAVRKSVRISEG